MATAEQASRQVTIKVSPEADKLITSGAHFLDMSKKDLVETAVAFYEDEEDDLPMERARPTLRCLRQDLAREIPPVRIP